MLVTHQGNHIVLHEGGQAIRRIDVLDQLQPRYNLAKLFP